MSLHKSQMMKCMNINNVQESLVYVTRMYAIRILKKNIHTNEEIRNIVWNNLMVPVYFSGYNDTKHFVERSNHD